MLGGCAPLLILVTVAVAVVGLGRNWIGQWLNAQRAPSASLSLAAANAAFHEGDLSAAVDTAQRWLAQQPADASARELLVRALLYRSYSEYDRAADRELALEISRGGLEISPRSLNMQAAHGYALQANGYAAEAGRIALRIVEQAPDHILARIVLSLSYGAQGIFEAALREAEVSVELARQQARYQVDSYRALAIAQGDAGNYRRAIGEMERAISHNDKLIPLHLEMALFALQVSDFDRATVAYYKVLSLDGDNVKARLRLCEMSNRLLERQSALRYCREVTELAPAWFDGWYKLGREYFLAGEYQRAQAAFSQCASVQIEQGLAPGERKLECWYLQGQSAEILGDCAALKSVYQQFLEMVRRGRLKQTWGYPPGGPPICAENWVATTVAPHDP